MIFNGKDNHVWPFLSLVCSFTSVLSLGKHEKSFCPNFHNLAKTKLVLHCDGPSFGQNPNLYMNIVGQALFSYSFKKAAPQSACHGYATDESIKPSSQPGA